MFGRVKQKKGSIASSSSRASGVGLDSTTRSKDPFSRDKVIHASDRFTAEKVSSLPKEIRDLLRSSDTAQYNGKFDCGYGLLIASNTIYVWDVASGLSLTKFNISSDTVLSSNLAAFYRSDNSHGLAVCADGVVRVWKSVTDPNDYWESNLRVHAEPTGVAYCEQIGVVVATEGGTENNLHLVAPNSNPRPFKSSSSWFGYILGTSRFPEVVSLVPGPRRSNFTELYVLTNLTIQKWELHSNTERMQQEFTLHARLKEALMRADASEYVVSLLDAKLANEGTLFVLASFYLAYCPTDADRKLNFVVARVRINGSSLEYLDFIEIITAKTYIKQDDTEIKPRLTVVPGANPVPCVSFSSSVVVVHSSVPEELNLNGDLIVASGLVKKSVFVLAEKSGCIKFTMAGQTKEDEPQQIQYVQQPQPQIGNNRDLLAVAVSTYSNGDKQKALQYASQIGPEFSELVVQFSFAILNNTQFSSSDPQWTSDPSSTMFLRKQIDAKKQKHTLLTDFLKDQDYGRSLWHNLSPDAQNIVDENGEKLVAGLNLRSAQTAQSEGDANRETLIQRAIKRTLDERKVEHIKSAVTAQEIFYSQVSTIDEILGPTFDFLLSAKPATSHSNFSYSLTEFKEANQIYLAFFSALSPSTLAQQRAHFHTKQLTLRTLGQKYLNLAKEFLRLDFGEYSKELYQQVYSLTRAVLAAFAFEVDSQRNEVLRHTYYQTREELLKVFLPVHMDMAVRLAEEFQDFHILLLICTETQDSDQIYDYMRRYNNEGFPEFVFEYFLKHNRYSELMELPAEFNEKLMQFLRPYPSLSWLQFLKCQKYSDASVALQEANEAEKVSLGRKKVLLSLAKLSSLAENVSAPVDRRIEQQMYMLRLQKTILPNETKPLDVKSLIANILKQSPAPVIQNVLSALSAAKESDTLLPGEIRSEIIEHIWKFSLEHGWNWNLVLNHLQTGRMEDAALRNAIESSVIFGAAFHPSNKGMLPRESLTHVFQTFLTEQSQVRPAEDVELCSRILETVYGMLLVSPACNVA